VSLKTFSYPNAVPLKRAEVAWGVEPGALQKFSASETLSSHEIRKFLMKTTTVQIPGKVKTAFKEYFVRFMVLSLKYPLIEDAEKGVLQLLDRDYLKPEDMVLFRKECRATFKALEKSNPQEFILSYFESSRSEYIAQFPKRVLIETLREMPYGSIFKAESKISHQMEVNLATCVHRMGSLIALIPIADQESRKILESNDLMKSLNPLIGSLRMRQPVADRHTELVING
jgi:hypothetical protein